MKKIFILCLTLFSFLISQAQMQYLKGSLQGSQETPQNASTAAGVVIVKYNTATKLLELFGNYAGLSDSITGSHIHRGQAGVAGPIVIELVNTGGFTGTLAVKATLTQPQEDSLLAGNMYANVHSKTFPSGEIRAQLTVSTSGQTEFLTARLQGAQETPPDSSKATGMSHMLLDKGTNNVYLTGSYNGLTGPSTDAHVHLQAPGTAGGVLFPITHSAAASGTLHAVNAVSAGAADSISKGLSYVNIHTALYPAGEIRGQLLNNRGVRYLAGFLTGASQVPPNESAAGGTVIVKYNTETNILILTGDYHRLSAPVSGSHIHTAPLGSNGPITINLTNTGDTTGVLSITDTLTDLQEADLLAGNMYVNVHNSIYPDGEIRTQLFATTDGETLVFTPALMGTQEVPANNSTATGNALVILDKATGMTFVTGVFQGINSTANMAHIHRGQAGVAGPVILPLFVSPAQSGTVSGGGILSLALVDSMVNGFTYLNIHSPFFPNGVIRGQLGDLVLPLKLTYFNGYKQRNEIELVWETSEELNVSRYEIEQLNSQTQQWMTKGSVPAKGESGTTEYSFTDIPDLYNNTYLIYRLKMIDKDGKITYSYLVKVNFEKIKAELFIRTNPVTNGELIYNITGLSTGKKAEVSIVDYNGRLLMKNVVSSLINNRLKISHLSAGMYKLIVRIDDTILQKSFIK